MLAELDDYDWREAFGFAGGPDGCNNGTPMRVEGATVDTDAFSREDVVEVIGITAGENDGEPWEVAGRLTDGRWFFLTAGCDYTGWDCVASGQAWVADDRDSLIQFGLPATTRERWGLA